MRVVSGLLIAIVGWALMAWAYFGHMRLDTSAPWSSGMMYVGDGPRSDLPRPADWPHLSINLRQLPPDPSVAALLQVMERASEDRGRNLSAQLSEKLLLLAPADARIGENALLSGRLPRAGHDEVLAGFEATAKDRFAVADREFTVVGVLRRDVALLNDCYLLPPHASVAALFDTSDGAVHPAVLVELPFSKLRDRDVREQLKDPFPRQRFAAVGAVVRADRWPYYLYLAGEGLLLLGGSWALIALYRVLAARAVGVGAPARGSWVGGPLAELAARPKLLGALHLVYFGLVIAGSAIVYNLPAVQRVLLSSIGEAFTAPHSPLAAVSKAYLSQNIFAAAAMTFLVNFFLGSILVITIPSLIVPGSGVLMAVVRATAWGLLLAPTFVLLSYGMLAHSGTLLLEGEGYILAAFFGLLVPIDMLRRDGDVGLVGRYGRVLMLNLQAMLLVAAVLATAACYEAVEVILMSN